MDLKLVKRFLEKGSPNDSSIIDSMPNRFFEDFISQGLKVDLIEHGRIICCMKIPTRLLNSANSLHGGAMAMLMDVAGSAVIYTVGRPMTRVSVEINVSYMDAAYAGEEIEIESKALRIGKTIAVVSVELRKKKTGKIIAQGRYTKYLAVSSKL